MGYGYQGGGPQRSGYKQDRGRQDPYDDIVAKCKGELKKNGICIFDWKGDEIFNFLKGKETDIGRTTTHQLRRLFSLYKRCLQQDNITDELQLAKIHTLYSYRKFPNNNLYLCAMLDSLTDCFCECVKDKNESDRKKLKSKFEKILEGLVAFGPDQE